MIIVRQATSQDEPAIFEFIKIAYPDHWRYKFPERWYWEYVDNPFLEGKGLPVFIAVDERGRIVGQTCTLVEPFKLSNQLRRVGWSVDTFVLPEYRGQGIGFGLQKANDEFNEVYMSLDMSPANRSIKARLGSVPLESLPIYYRLLRYHRHGVAKSAVERLGQEEGLLGQLLPHVMKWTLADRLGAATRNVLLSLRDRWLLGKASAGLAIEPILSFGEEFDRLWEKVSPCFYAIVQRDSRYLNWKYVRQPFMNYQCFAARRHEEPCGYVVLRVCRPPEPNLGIIADLFAPPDDLGTILALLRWAVLFFRKVGVENIDTATSVPAYQRSLERLGFHKIGDRTPMFHCRSAGFDVAEVLEPGRWFLGKSDHDWDQYPLAR